MFRIAIVCLCAYFFQSQCSFSQAPYATEFDAERAKVERQVRLAEHPFASLTILVGHSKLLRGSSAFDPDPNGANTVGLAYSVGDDGGLYSLNRIKSLLPGKSPEKVTFKNLAKRIRTCGKTRDHSVVNLSIHDQNNISSDLDILAITIQNLEEIQDTIEEFAKFQLVVKLAKKEMITPDSLPKVDK